MAIHPTAIISPKAELDSTVEVGPYVIIEENVRVGANTRILTGAHLSGYTEIGRDNQIHMGAVIGHVPQDVKFDAKSRTYLRVGDRNIFREYCTVHRSAKPEEATVIGNDCFLMALSHVGHDCVIGNGVIICNGACVAGHVTIGDRVFISGNVVIHQFIHVGRLAMVGGGARVSMDIPPFTLAAERNEVYSLNLVGLRRAKLPVAAVSELKRLFKLFYHSEVNGTLALKEAMEDPSYTTAEAKEFIEFIRVSPNGMCPGPKSN
jgi:UDP-N-acetylglucosamine acyltransferase